MVLKVQMEVLDDERLTLPVKVPHTNLTEVTWVVLVHVGAVVVLATGKTATTGMLSFKLSIFSPM